MNLNQQIKSKGSHLTREDLAAYRSTNDEGVKHSIEKEALENNFESDALEGWSEISMKDASMKRLDKHFIKSNIWIYWVTGAVSIIVITSLFLFSTENEKNKTQGLSNPIQTVLVEKTDILFPESIEAMEELPIKQQIAIKTIVKDFSEQQKEQTTPHAQATEIGNLSPKKLDDPSPKAVLIKETLMGKEIYLNELKLLDYRAYRSKPSITSKQMLLSGTPANIGEEKATEEEPIWKDVEIPYIDYLDKTMEIFSKGQNKKALTRFLIILEAYPDDLNANFYAGLCYYNLKEYQSAIQSFDKCFASKFINFNEEVEWYMAKSLLAEGKKSEAKILFEKIVSDGGYYSKQAEKLL